MNSNNDQYSNTRSQIRRFIGSAVFVLFLVFFILNFLADRLNPQNQPDRPIEEMIAEIERDGSQATCSDLNGKWHVLETSLSYKFKSRNRLTSRWGLFGLGGYGSTLYHCAGKMVSYSRSYWIGDEHYTCTDEIYLGKINNDTIITSWDYCSEGEGDQTHG